MPRRPRVDERDPLLRERLLELRLAVERVPAVRGDFAAPPLDRELLFAPDERELLFAADERDGVRAVEDLARVDVDLRPPLLARVPALADRVVDLRPLLDLRAPDDLRALPVPRDGERDVEVVLELEDTSTDHLPDSTR